MDPFRGLFHAFILVYRLRCRGQSPPQLLLLVQGWRCRISATHAVKRRIEEEKQRALKQYS